MFKIGNVTIEHDVVIAPMAGITNQAFRTMMKAFGAGLVYSEMVSDKAICFKNDKTLGMLAIDENEHPISMQVFGGDVQTITEAAVFIDQTTKCDIIDINMGCPVNKVLKADAGSKLMLYPDKIYEMVKSVVTHVHKPVTVKIRAGFDHEHRNAVEVAQLIEKAGASAIAIHGRTRAQMYEGQADWNIIREVKAAVKIPVIGNGDVRTPQDAKRMLETTGVDAVMVGRAALGNPWVIARMVTYLETGTLLPEPTAKERIEQCLAHASQLMNIEPERVAMSQMRGQAPWYIKGLKSASYIKNSLTRISTYAQLENILGDYLSYLETGDETILAKFKK